MKTNKLTREELYEKLQREPVYLYNEYEQAVVKLDNSLPNYLVKLKGREEFKAITGSGVVAEAILDLLEISKEDYDNF